MNGPPPPSERTFPDARHAYPVFVIYYCIPSEARRYAGVSRVPLLAAIRYLYFAITTFHNKQDLALQDPITTTPPPTEI